MSDESHREYYVGWSGEKAQVDNGLHMLPNIAGRPTYGMKGTISESELGVLRARMLDAAHSKAACGELRISVQIVYVWHPQI